MRQYKVDFVVLTQKNELWQSQSLVTGKMRS